MNDLKDRIVMITGASSGFGKEAAKMCVGLGAKVVLGARREDKLKELCDELCELSRSHYTVVHLIRMHFFVGGSSILGRIRMLARPRV